MDYRLMRIAEETQRITQVGSYEIGKSTIYLSQDCLAMYRQEPSNRFVSVYPAGRTGSISLFSHSPVSDTR